MGGVHRSWKTYSISGSKRGRTGVPACDFEVLDLTWHAQGPVTRISGTAAGFLGIGSHTIRAAKNSQSDLAATSHSTNRPLLHDDIDISLFPARQLQLTPSVSSQLQPCLNPPSTRSRPTALRGLTLPSWSRTSPALSTNSSKTSQTSSPLCDRCKLLLPVR